MSLTVVRKCLESKGNLVGSVSDLDSRVVTELERLIGFSIYPRSFYCSDGSLYCLARNGHATKWLIVLSREPRPAFHGSIETRKIDGTTVCLQRCPADEQNAFALKRMLAFAAPTLVGLKKSFGFGDRLGIATPGHVRAIRGHAMTPIFAQQSIREMQRTGRSPGAVIADAVWGVLQEGWTETFGADADHLKHVEDIDVCSDAGFTLYTIDPSDYIDEHGAAQTQSDLEAAIRALPWEILEIDPAALERRYIGTRLPVGQLLVEIDRQSLMRILVTYGRAVAYSVQAYRRLRDRIGEESFELEISLDETETPTTLMAHFFVASELFRLGVRWVSLAPRFPGRFEKGIDYVGDLSVFEKAFAAHVALARVLGPYKISVHSGSDKFTLYPIIARHGGDLVHVKTAGTSYVEALRVIATYDPLLFREIISFARTRYATDRATYYVSADPSSLSDLTHMKDEALPGLLDLPEVRQVLHVTYGSILTASAEDGSSVFKDRILEILRAHEEEYYALLHNHLTLHIAPFDSPSQ